LTYLISNDATVVTVVLFLLGLVFGSFLNVCIFRIPLGRSVVAPRSACPNCGRAIRAYDNIPVLGWILLRGRCRNCKTKISSRYVAVELLTAFLFVACYWRAANLPETAKLCIFSFLVLGLIFIDAEHHLLPNRLTIPGVWVGLLFSLIIPVNGLDPNLFWTVRHPLPPQLVWFANSLLGAAVGALVIYAAGELYFRVRGIEGMGFGDVKFMGMIGAFLGIKLTLFTILGASILGTLFGSAVVLFVWQKRVRRRKRALSSAPNIYARSWRSAQLILRAYELPFGVFLGGVALAALFFGDTLIHWYMALY
jgi:leader peptidase (prepilin peptidase) / N-methyltransferase